MARQLLSSFSKWLPKFLSVPSTTSMSDDLKKLEHLLEKIQAVLRDAEDRENREETVKLWLQELTDVAYDAEDVLLEYHYYVLQAQIEEEEVVAERKRKLVDMEVTHLASGSNFSVREVSMPHNMADRIKKIRRRFDEISKDQEALKLKPEDGEIRPDSFFEYPLESDSMTIGQSIYGREDDKNKLVKLLLSESKFEIIAVHGKGGLGKTTLAQLVYNDQTVSHHFQNMRIWIWVPENCNPEQLTKLMMERITNSPCRSSSDSSDLRESLRKSLRGKRVLLVLDDVWISEKERMWEPLSSLFQSAETMKMIVTTRNAQVAEAMTATMLYPLDHLPWEQCWQLFVHRAFGDQNPGDFPTLEKIGKEIVKKCRGLPLSVKSLGALLRQYETDEGAWRDVLESDLWELEEENNILPALRVSYSRMPSHLRPCFEICSMFPKYHEFQEDELVKLWAAQGYLQQLEAGKGAEEMGHKYFKELHRRSFFDEYGGVYRMHDNIRDLALYVLKETNKKHANRHLYLNRGDVEKFLTSDYTESPRTLIVHGSDIGGLNDIFLKLRRSLMPLRYLALIFSKRRDFERTCDWEFERKGSLICLRHLQLRIGTNISALESVCRLYHLVVLDICCDGYIQFPGSFRSLVSLTTIRFLSTENDELPALGELPSLISLTLMFFPVRRIGSEFCRAVGSRQDDGVAFPSLTSLVFEYMLLLEEWGGLRDGDFPRLQNLEINGCKGLSSLPALQKDSLSPNRSVLQNLTTLKKSHDGKKLRLPQGFGGLAKLESLSGHFTVKSKELFGILHQLVNLKWLNLKWDTSDCHDCSCIISDIPREYMDCSLCLMVEGGRGHEDSTSEEDEGSHRSSNNASYNLEYLKIHDYEARRWPSWSGDPSFNKLTNVELHRCPNVDRLPTLGQLPSLEHLQLFGFHSVKRVGEEFCRGINGRRDVAAFPSLTELTFCDFREWEEWDGVLDGDFPQLQKLEACLCPKLSIIPNQGNIRSHFFC